MTADRKRGAMLTITIATTIFSALMMIASLGGLQAQQKAVDNAKADYNEALKTVILLCSNPDSFAPSCIENAKEALYKCETSSTFHVEACNDSRLQKIASLSN